MAIRDYLNWITKHKKMETQILTQKKNLEEFQLARFNDSCRPELAKQMDKIQKKIITTNSNFPLLRNIPSQDHEMEIRKMIAVVCGLLGIKNFPEENLFPFIFQFICENYSSLSPQAMIHAFELNALDELPVKHEHFQCFSIEFIGGVLGDYIHLKRKTFGVLKLLAKPTDPVFFHSDSQCYQGIVEFVKKHRKMPMSWNWNSVYKHMESAGIVDEGNAWLRDFKEKVKAKVKAEMHKEKLTAASAIERLNIDHSFTLDSLNLRCRKEYVIYKLMPLADKSNA